MSPITTFFRYFSKCKFLFSCWLNVAVLPHFLYSSVLLFHWIQFRSWFLKHYCLYVWRLLQSSLYYASLCWLELTKTARISIILTNIVHGCQSMAIYLSFSVASTNFPHRSKVRYLPEKVTSRASGAMFRAPIRHAYMSYFLPNVIFYTSVHYFQQFQFLL